MLTDEDNKKIEKIAQEIFTLKDILNHTPKEQKEERIQLFQELILGTLRLWAAQIELNNRAVNCEHNDCKLGVLIRTAINMVGVVDSAILPILMAELGEPTLIELENKLKERVH